MRNHLFILILAIGFMACDGEVQSPGEAVAEPTVPGKANGVLTLDPVAFSTAEFINVLPDGNSLTFPEFDQSVGLGFTSMANGFGFTTLSPTQVDQSQFSFGEGSLRIGEENFDFQIVTCSTIEGMQDLFPGEKVNPATSEYLIIIAIGVDPASSKPESEATHMLNLVVPAGYQGTFSIPNEEFDGASVSFFDFDRNSFFVEEAVISIMGGEIQFEGIFRTSDFSFEPVEFKGHVTCGS